MQESGEDRMRVVTGARGFAKERKDVLPIERKKRGGKSGGAEESVAGAN